MKTALTLCIFILLTSLSVVCRAQTTNISTRPSYKVVTRAANSQVYEQIVNQDSPTDKTIPHRVTAIATGMNHWDGTKWSPSDPTFQMSADSQFVYANQVQIKVRLAADLASSNSVSITTPDGIVLNSTPVAIGLYNEISGDSLIIASITNCSGTIISSNRVLYENCFNGISGDVLYTLQRGSFSQDIIWRQNIDPADYGFPTNSTRIQIFSAFNSPAPQQTARPLYVETNQTVRAQMASPDFIDHTLKFGQLKFGPGRAFSTTSTNRFKGAPMAKDFETINRQSYLIESVKYKDLKADLQSLPRVAVLTKPKNQSHERKEAEKAGHQSRDRLPDVALAKAGEKMAKSLKNLPIPLPPPRHKSYLCNQMR